MKKLTKWSLILGFVKSNRNLVTLSLLTGLAYNFFTILIPISIGKFYEFAFGFSSHRLKVFGFIPYMDAVDHGAFFTLFFTLVGLRFAFEYTNRYSIGLIGERFAKVLREQLFDTQIHLIMPIYHEKGIGKYLLRFSGDLNSIQNYVKNGVLRFLQDVILLAFVFSVIAYMDLNMGMIIMGGISIAVLLLWILNKMLYRQSLERRNRRSGILSFVNTRLRGIAALKAFNKYTPEKKRFGKRSERLYRIGKKYNGTLSLVQAIVPAMTYGLLGAIMLYVLYGAPMDGGSLLVVILLVLAILPVLRRTLKVSVVWKMGGISIKKLINIFELPKENDISFEKRPLKNGSILFEDVQFSYNEFAGPVFANLNLKIIPNTTTFFYGSSGSGKSTFIKLLLKNVLPKNGRLSFGGIPYASLSEKAIRKHIAVVSEDYPLYGKDVYEAITYSRNEQRMKKAKKLLQIVQQHEELKDRLYLHDNIGDLGSNLNSGQTKLLLYARALLTDKPIIIIEEPLQYLNSKTGQLILDLLRDFHHQKTLVLLGQLKIPNLEPDYIYDLNANSYTKNNSVSSLTKKNRSDNKI